MRMMHEATVQGRKLPRLLRGRNPARDSCPPVPLDRINGTSRRPPWLSSNRKTCWDGSRGVLPGNRSVPAIDPTFKRRWELFGPIANCSSGLKKYGSKADGHKWLCGVDAAMQNEGCVVYSIGSNNEWDFELSIAKATNCEIHTFDCNVAIPKVPPKLSSRLTFHKFCVAGRNELDAEGHAFRTLASIQAELGHKKVDLLKVDIEGFEWELFNTWEDTQSTLPFQISTELHLTAFWNSAGAPDTSARKHIKNPAQETGESTGTHRAPKQKLPTTGKLWWAGPGRCLQGRRRRTHGAGACMISDTCRCHTTGVRDGHSQGNLLLLGFAADRWATGDRRSSLVRTALSLAKECQLRISIFFYLNSRAKSQPVKRPAPLNFLFLSVDKFLQSSDFQLNPTQV